MSLESNTSKTLKYSVYASMAVIVIGVILNIAEITDKVLWTGVLLLIISPFIGVLVSTISLAIEKDYRWVAVAAILIAISVIGMIV